MANYNPAPGESVGYFVTSGNARNNQGPFGPSEPSNIIMITYPNDSGQALNYPASNPSAARTAHASNRKATVPVQARSEGH